MNRLTDCCPAKTNGPLNGIAELIMGTTVGLSTIDPVLGVSLSLEQAVNTKTAITIIAKHNASPELSLFS
jgi:hypothetical protein